MHTHVYRRTILHLSLLGIVGSILVGFYDVIFSHVFEVFHLIFEIVEIGLDRLVEHFFDTELHETQLIVFYILMVVGSVLIYVVWKLLVHLFSGAGQSVHQEWTEFKDAIVTDWQGMSMTNRVIAVSLFLLVNYLASFLLF
ncbi:MAG: hypothetical protein ABL933_10675 [Methyloglobulus sp.]|nr:hypothetical protein [Methyloglobulus sp.]